MNRTIRAKINIHTQHACRAANVLHLELLKESRPEPLEVRVNSHQNQVINMDANKENNNFLNHKQEQTSVNRTLR